MDSKILKSLMSVVLVIGLMPTLALAEDTAADDVQASSADGTSAEANSSTSENATPDLQPEVAPFADEESESESPVTSSEEGEKTLNGTCGATEADNVNWALTQNAIEGEEAAYTLTISGTGAMADYTCNINRASATQPWRESETGIDPTKAITAVEVEEGVTNVGAFAFNGLEKVETYDIAASVSEIKVWGVDFHGVTSIALGSDSNFKVVGNALLSVDGQRFLGYFGGAEPCEDYTTPVGVTTIDSGAFVGCDAKVLNVGDGVTSVGGWLLSGSETESVNLPDSVTELSTGIFSGNPKLKHVSTGSGVKTLPSLTFNGCANLEEVELSNSLESIENQAFMNCPSLKSIHFPQSLRKIGEQAFKNCSSLNSIALPDELGSIGSQAFFIESGHEPGLQTVKFGSNLPTFGTGVWRNQTKITSIDLSDCKATSIPNNAFAGMSSLEAVSLPEGLTTIGTYSFQGCTSLKSVVFPDSLTGIETGAFGGCSGLETIIFGSGIDDIASGAFNGCTGAKVVDLHRASLIGEKYGNNGGDYALNYATYLGSKNTSYFLRSKTQAGSVKGNIEWGSGGAGTGNLTNTYYVLSDSNATVDVAGSVSWRLHRFDGWYDNSSLTGNAVAEPQASNIYYAKWAELPAVASLNDTDYESLRAAIDAADSSHVAVVKLLDNTTESIEIPEGKTIQLDLNGKTLENEAGKHTIMNNGTLTIGGTGTVDNVSHGCGALYNGPTGEVTVSGGTFERSDENGIEGSNSWYTIKNFGFMTIKGDVTVLQSPGGDKDNYSSLIGNGWQGGSSAGQPGKEPAPATHYGTLGAQLFIESGSFSGGITTIKNDDMGYLTISGGSFTNTKYETVLNWNEATIRGGTFSASGEAQAVIANGYINDAMDCGKMSITGGSFTGATIISSANGSSFGTVEISGSADFVGVFQEGLSGLTVKGGTFNNDSFKPYCEPGYAPSKNSEGKYTPETKQGWADVSKYGNKTTVPNAVDFGYENPETLAFAGWYTDEKAATPYKETTGMAYAKFVPIESLVKCKGGSLRMDLTGADDYSATSLRFGYEMHAPSGSVLDRDNWGWTWRNPANGKSGFTKAANYWRIDGNGVIANLVITPIYKSGKKAGYSTQFESTAQVAYTTADGTHVLVKEQTQTRSVEDVAKAIKNDTFSSADELAYAEGILK